MEMRLILICIICCISGLSHSQSTLQWNASFPLDSNSVEYGILSKAHSAQQNTLLGTLERFSQSSNDLDPLVLMYDAAGNLALNWSHKDSAVMEFNTMVAFDTVGAIYITTECFEYATSNIYTSLVKLNPITFQEEFRMTFSRGTQNSKFLVKGNFIYLISTKPVSQLNKIDLQGNLLQSTSLSYFAVFRDFLSSNDYLYVIGDTIVGNNYKLKFEKLDFNGTHINAYTSTFLDDYYGDAIVNNLNTLTYAFGYNAKVGVVQLNNNFSAWDTVINAFSGSEALAYNSSNQLYIAFGTVNEICSIAKLSAGQPLLVVCSVDSISNQNITVVDMDIDQNGNFILFNTHVSNFPTLMDYQLTCFDSIGSHLWSYRLDNEIYDYSKGMFLENQSMFNVGLQRNSIGELSTNVHKIDYVTGLWDLRNSNVRFYCYPNPLTSNKLYFNYNLTCEIEVYSNEGKLVLREFIENTNTINLPANLKTGLYLIHVRSKTYNLTSKLNYYEN